MAYFWANRSVDFMNVIYSTAVDTSYFDYDGYGNAQGVLWTYANGMQMAVDGHGIDAYGITGTIDYCWVWDSVYDSVEAYGISGGNLPVSTAINAVLAGNLWPTVFAGGDTFSGSYQADRLLGYGGDDTLAGNGGNDQLYGGYGSDMVRGGYDNDAVYGDAGNDRVYGDAGNDAVSGGSGNDFLNGGAGRDTLIGGAGSDSFDFTTKPLSASADRIADFNPAFDTIRLDNAAMPGLGGSTGTLAPSKFWVGAHAHDANDRVIYDSAHGKLLYDSNGSSAGGEVLVATLSPGLHMTYNDIVVI
jgi:Ca2+-binding RTX toxin-like protein